METVSLNNVREFYDGALEADGDLASKLNRLDSAQRTALLDKLREFDRPLLTYGT